MLTWSLGFLLVAALIGAGLAAGHLRGAVPERRVAALHGLLAVLGFALLLAGLRGPPRGEAMGVGSFGRVAAVLLALALLTGIGMLLVRWRRRSVLAPLIGLHATLAISGVVVLAAYALMG